MGWEASIGELTMQNNVKVINWTVEKVTHWDIEPICYMYINDSYQPDVHLDIIVYSKFVFKYHISIFSSIVSWDWEHLDVYENPIMVPGKMYD